MTTAITAAVSCWFCWSIVAAYFSDCGNLSAASGGAWALIFSAFRMIGFSRCGPEPLHLKKNMFSVVGRVCMDVDK